VNLNQHHSRPKHCVASTLIALIFFAAMFGCSRREPFGRAEILVAAASDLTLAFEDIGRQFEQETGIKATFSYGSTGTLARQIENGAPVDIFAAANVEFIEQLERQGLIVPGSKALYARGRLTVWRRADSALKIERIEELAQPQIASIAIAQPEHAPYGKAAREALESAGIWKEVEPKLVYGENVRQTMQYAETGNADVAIIALSLSVQSNGRWLLIPEQLHKPLDQALAVIKGSRSEGEARRFAEFVNSGPGRDTMRRYGFILPGESMAP
jgi:molybdate transport system substrate-binding protein